MGKNRVEEYALDAITVILTVWKRNHLEEQLQALFQQTVLPLYGSNRVSIMLMLVRLLINIRIGFVIFVGKIILVYLDVLSLLYRLRLLMSISWMMILYREKCL